MERRTSFTFIGGPSDEDDNQVLKDVYDDLRASDDPMKIRRGDFPKGFVFGSAASAYQHEGGAAEGGRGSSTWDAFSLGRPEKISDGSNGNVTADQYHLFKEDVKLMKKVGLDAYRFSISWTRILPGGKLSAGINREGIKYYNDLIDTLLAEGIKPYVTIFHWDFPLALQHDYGGFLSKKVVKDFRDYAELCFFEFGDRVKHWITFNEAWSYTYFGYVTASFPPCRGSTTISALSEGASAIKYKSSGKIYTSQHGNPGTEPYIVAHHFLLAHAAAVALYRKRFQPHQGGMIGMTNNVNWYEPLDVNKPEDKQAALRAVDFMFGWFVSPLVTGEYPDSMREIVGDRLPEFKPWQVELVKGSYDFLGVNYYTTYYAADDPSPLPPTPNYITDQRVISTPFRDEVPIGPQGGSSWLYIVPRGIYELMDYINTEYNSPLIYITENGVDELNNQNYTIEQAQHDSVRIKYHHDHLVKLKQAIDEKNVNVLGYFLWSFCDNYEWNSGYTVRFGIFYVDFINGRLTRYPKKSALWLANFLSAGDDNRSSMKREIKEIEEKHDLLTKK